MNRFKQFLLLEEAKNSIPIKELTKYAEERDELYLDDDKFIVIKPKTHESACFYGQFTISKFCIANPEDSSDWDMLDSVRQQLGQPASFYYVFSKLLSKKNKKSAIGIVTYPKRYSEMAMNRSDDEIIASARERFANEYDGSDLSYEDEFLKEWLSQIRRHDSMFESYNSKNKIMLPDELRSFIGANVFNFIIGNEN